MNRSIKLVHTSRQSHSQEQTGRRPQIDGGEGLIMFLGFRIAALALAAVVSGSAFGANPDWMNAVGEALGKTGNAMPGGVYRVGLPRSDLKVALDGVEIKPALALGSWLAFTKNGNDGMVMGDLVLLASEVNPVMKKLEE